MVGIEPNDTPAPTVADHTELAGISLPASFGKGDRGIQVGHNLGIGNLGDDGGDNRTNIHEFGYITLASKEFWGDRVVAELGKPTAQVEFDQVPASAKLGLMQSGGMAE